jgi:RHS repeat-associated protein
MKPASCFNLSTSPPTQAERKPPGKELDTETGLYYFGARYLDPKTGRWISGDPAISEYIPSEPVSDEARERNGSLPGMGGVFNVVNLHVYHYAGNNSVKYIDPDGDNFYNYTDKDITVITEDGKAVTVHSNEMYEGGIDGAVLYDDTILKVNTFSMMAVFGTDDNYRAVALGILNALIDLGKKLFKKMINFLEYMNLNQKVMRGWKVNGRI